MFVNNVKIANINRKLVSYCQRLKALFIFNYYFFKTNIIYITRGFFGKGDSPKGV